LEHGAVRLPRSEVRRRPLQEQQQVVRLLREGGRLRARAVPDAAGAAGAEARAGAQGQIAEGREEEVMQPHITWGAAEQPGTPLGAGDQPHITWGAAEQLQTPLGAGDDAARHADGRLGLLDQLLQQGLLLVGVDQLAGGEEVLALHHAPGAPAQGAEARPSPASRPDTRWHRRAPPRCARAPRALRPGGRWGRASTSAPWRCRRPAARPGCGTGARTARPARPPFARGPAGARPGATPWTR